MKVVMGSVQSNGVAFKVVPKIDSVSPTGGKVGSVVTISGQGFGTWAAGTTSVYFGKVKATTYSAWGNYVVKVKVPSGVSGTVQVKVVTAGGTSATKNFSVKR